MWMSHVTLTNESRHTLSHHSRMSCVTLMWMSHVTLTNESRHTLSHHSRMSCVTLMWMSHVTLTNESRHTHKRVTSHSITLINRPWHTYEWATSHSRMGHITRMGHVTLTKQGIDISGNHFADPTAHSVYRGLFLSKQPYILLSLRQKRHIIRVDYAHSVNRRVCL